MPYPLNDTCVKLYKYLAWADAQTDQTGCLCIYTHQPFARFHKHTNSAGPFYSQAMVGVPIFTNCRFRASFHGFILTCPKSSQYHPCLRGNHWKVSNTHLGFLCTPYAVVRPSPRHPNCPCFHLRDLILITMFGFWGSGVIIFQKNVDGANTHIDKKFLIATCAA